jgi:hypothetical protein
MSGLVEKGKLVVDAPGFGYSVSFYEEGAQLQDVRLVLQPEAIVSGQLLKADGSPVKGGLVRLATEDPALNLKLVGFTDLDGKFIFKKLPAGRCVITRRFGHEDQQVTEAVDLKTGQHATVQLVEPSK